MVRLTHMIPSGMGTGALLIAMAALAQTKSVQEPPPAAGKQIRVEVSLHVTGAYQHTGPKTIPQGARSLVIKHALDNSYSTEYVVAAEELASAARELDPESYQQEFGGEFVNAGQNRAYHAYNAATHLRSVSFEPWHPLIWSIDFNVNPMCMLLMQRIGDEVRVFDEIALRDANTEEACKVFQERIAPLYKQASAHAPAPVGY